jgi:hypothetical protein
MPDGNPTLPLYQSLRLHKNSYILLCPFALSCPPLGRERGGNLLGGKGVNGKCEMMMMGDDDDEQLFTLFIQWLFEGSRITQN